MTDKFCELGKESKYYEKRNCLTVIACDGVCYERALSEGKDIMSINKEKLRPIVRDISTTPRSYILEDEDVTISCSLERKQESIKNILNNEGNE